jgi:hypothetical protein
MFGVLFFFICLSKQTPETMNQKLQDLIINITVPLAWVALWCVAIFVVFLLPQAIWNVLCK